MRAVFLLTFVTAVTVTTSVTADFLWTASNCPDSLGNVTDTLCCGPSTFCRKLVSEAACTSDVDNAALYCEWSEGQCQPVVDRRSNVCCRDQEVNSCAKMFSGECPEQFEVARECCQGDAYTKFAFLKTSDPSKICCNAPCAAMEAANCTLAPQCGPSQRSFGLHNPYLSLGFFGHGGLHGHNLGSGFDHRFGTIFYGTGFGHDYPPYGHRRHRKHRKSKKHHKKDRYDHDDDHYDHKDHKDHYDDHDDYYDDHDDYKEDYVDEITVDDIFALMIDAMEKETDVKHYDADVTSDPYLGKTYSGGLFVDHHFPDTEPIFDELYRYPNYYGHYGRGPYASPWGLNFGGPNFGLGLPYGGAHHYGGLQSPGGYYPPTQGGHYPSGPGGDYSTQGGSYATQSGLSSQGDLQQGYPPQGGVYPPQGDLNPYAGDIQQGGSYPAQGGHYPPQSGHYQAGPYAPQGDLYAPQNDHLYPPQGDLNQASHYPAPPVAHH